MFLKLTMATLAIGMVLAGAAGAVVDTDVLDYEVRLPQSQIAPVYSNPDDAQALELLPALSGFRSGEGAGWKLLQWNGRLETPAAMAGPAIPLVASGAAEPVIRASVEAFVARNAGLLRVDPRDLRITDVIEIGPDRTYVILSQFHDGIEVLFGRVDVGLWEGQVILLGSDFHTDVDVNRFPVLDAAAAGHASHLGIPSAPGDAVDAAPRLVILPLDDEGTRTYHLAWEVVLQTNEPEGRWRTLVDAHDGSVLWRESLYQYFEVSGTVRGDVEETYNDFYDYPLEDARVRASGTYTGYTNVAGEFVITVPNNTDYSNVSELYGYFCNVNNYGGTDATITIVGGPGDPIDFYYDFGNSHPAERCAYYHVNVVHDWIKGVDPTFDGLDYVMSANVERDNTCNAYWNGISVNFYRAGGGCNSTGRIADVIYHEYGHGITQELYSPNSPPTSSGMGEGFSDIVAMAIHPDPLIGEYFYTNGGAVRDAENLRQYPGTECGGQVHCLGEIIMGAMWKTRKNMVIKYGEAGTPAVWDVLHVETAKTRPYSMPNYLTRLLMTDDDDGNLNNGTPNWYEICDAFILHNLPCPALTNYVVVSSDAIDDQPQDVGGYVITATAQAIGGGAIDPGQVEIYYTTDPVGDGATWITVPMTATGNPNEYQGEIPNLGCGEIVNYYVRAAKYTGEWATAPHLAPYRGTYEFMTGAYDVSLVDDLEADQGWTLGWAGDDATEGFWERVDPVGKESASYGVTQPEDDHTASGSLCFVTDGRGGAWFAYDVDNGVTSVVSPVFDWSTNSGVVGVRFWSFFIDETWRDDALRLFVSNDGGSSWQEIWTLSGYGHNQWEYQKIYFKDDLIGFTDQMRFRFTMEDLNRATTCAEAALDDIEIRVNDCSTTDAVDGTVPVSFLVEQNRPNPFNPKTAIRFGLPSAGPVEVAIFDAAGRKVRTVLDGNRAAGYYTVVWNGRDDQNRSVGSGVYYYTVKAGADEAGHKMMLLK